MSDDDRDARGDEILARVLTGDEWDSGISNDLLSEFLRGYPVKKLVALLTSDNEKLLQSGAWIASELTTEARPILKYLHPLFDNPNVSVRYYSVETALTAATEKDREVVGKAASLITDSEPQVRRMAFEFMTRAEAPVLAAGVPYMRNPELSSLLGWVLNEDGGSHLDDAIVSRLREPGLRQLFAVIAAARAYARDPQYLRLATSLAEGDARSLAVSELAWLTKLREQAQRRRERAERRGA